GDNRKVFAAMRDQEHNLTVFDDGLLLFLPSGQVRAAIPTTLPLDALLPADLQQVLPGPGQRERLSGLVHARDGHSMITYAFSLGERGTLIAMGDLTQGSDLSYYLPPGANGGHAAVEDSQGWVLASNEAALRFNQNEHAEWVRARLAAAVSYVGEATKGHVMAFAPIGHTGWGMVYGESDALLMADRLELIHRLLLMGFAAIALIIGLSWWDTSTLIGPLRRLTAHAGRIADGDLSAAVMVRRQDEVGMLGQAFETMRQRLQTSRTELNAALADAVHAKQEAASLYAVSQEILQPRAEGSALQTVVDRARDLVGARAAALCLPIGTDCTLKPVALSGVVIEPPPSTPQDTNGWMSFPVMAGDMAAAGILCVAPLPGESIPDRERRLLAGLANLAAIALANERLQEESRRLVVYAERERIARDLHDSVSQSLSYLYSQLEYLKAFLSTLTTEQLQAELESLAKVTSVAFDEARDSIYSLRATGTGRDPLPSAIAGCVRDFTARSGLKVDLETDAMADVKLSAEAEVQLVRVVQEALANVTKHSRATRVQVTAAVQPGELHVAIQDDGVGFNSREPRSGRRSFGLEMMRERIESVGGRLEIQSRPGTGTIIHLMIPVMKA
ncbi:MAG: HAMP domain-containing protein, partial [Mycobacterium leprae]